MGESENNERIASMIKKGAEFATFFAAPAFVSVMIMLIVLFFTGDLKSAEALGPIFIVVAILCFISTVGFAILDMKFGAYLFAVIGIFSTTFFCMTVVL